MCEFHQLDILTVLMGSTLPDSAGLECDAVIEIAHEPYGKPGLNGAAILPWNQLWPHSGKHGQFVKKATGLAREADYQYGYSGRLKGA